MARKDTRDKRVEEKGQGKTQEKDNPKTRVRCANTGAPGGGDWRWCLGQKEGKRQGEMKER